VKFDVISPFRATVVIASGRGIRILPRLVRLYGRGQWRKMKGTATVRFEDGTIPKLNFTGSKLTASANGN
jgi:hypothetical protein